MSDELTRQALAYHQHPRPGKIEITATKPVANQRDLALAYSPGVAAPCLEIAADQSRVADYTARSNLVGVITNGTAVLGLGNIGPLAAKPVMEGKAVLFKKFAGIDVFDIEIAETDPKRLVDVIASLEPTFGGINLEDIKAPECFEIEAALRERVRIPVFHDDQHGTAIIAAAAILNALRVVGKSLGEVKLVTSGAGAAAIACLRLLERLGLPREHVTVTDLKGVIYVGRPEYMDPHKAAYARDTVDRTLADAIRGADIFLGLSAPGVLTGGMVKTMAASPIILALANPTPEILPEEARAARPDAIIATGRSDYPNQVNNALCFPYIFRGALDVGATTISEEMKIACVHALAELTLAESSDIVAAAYGGEDLRFGPDYLIPKPFDPRLISSLAPAVARAAMESGVATRPIADLDAYRDGLERFVFQSVLVMRPLFEQAKRQAKRVVYAEGEEPKVLRAVQTLIDEGLAEPVLVGRPEVVVRRIERLGLRVRPGTDFEVVNPQEIPRYYELAAQYHDLMGRRGISPEDARTALRTESTVLGAMMLKTGQGDALICGVTGRFHDHLRHLIHIIGLRAGVQSVSTMSALIVKKGTYFLCDTFVNPDPSPAQIAEITRLAAQELARLGIAPKVALLSHSNFGSSIAESANKMREALKLIREASPDLEVEGEMRAETALSERLRAEVFPAAALKAEANLLVMPSLDAANIALGLATTLADGVTIGPILLGLNQPAHILTPSATVRGIVNMSTLGVVDAQAEAARAAPAG